MSKRVVMERLGRVGEEAEAFDREFWRRVGHEGRLDAVWHMALESRLIKGEHGSELRLQRSAEAFTRRAG